MTERQRHPETLRLLAYFQYDHLPRHLQEVSGHFARCAHDVARDLPDGPELTAGLRKLLEAKDCAVRHAVDMHRREPALRAVVGAQDPKTCDQVHPEYGTYHPEGH